MHTYSAAMSNRAAGAARRIVRERFGADYLPAKPRVFRSSARNGREAHEAIRPTDFSRAPESLAGRIGEDEAGLYALIWQPAVASQMVAARLDRVRVEIESESGDVALAATGSRIVFDGFLRVWHEGGEEDGAEDGGALETLAFAVTLNRATWSWVRVDYATRDGTATAGVDYTATSGTLAFAPGEPEKAVNVAILDDAIDEGKEHFFLTLSNPQGAFFRNRHCEAKGVIMNDDPLQKM